jgi:hypothetical protein
LNTEVLKVVAEVAGIGGIALVMFFYLNREVLRRNVFSSLTKQQSYRIIRLILVSCCVISLSGIAAWVFIEQQSGHRTPLLGQASLPSWSDLQEISIESFDVPYPGIENLWPTFKDAKWSGGIAAGKYYLTNATDAAAINYIWQQLKVDASNLPVTADISFADSKTNASFSAAGLLYRFDPRSKYYYAFCIDQDGLYTFYRRDDNGLNTVSSGRSQRIDGQIETRLGIIGVGGELRLYINNSLVKVVQDEALKSGLAGVIALGIGEFRFDNFTVYKAASKPP